MKDFEMIREKSNCFEYGRDGYKVSLDRAIFLAPLAGASELSFRKICHRLGAGQVFTELVSARGIRYSGIESSWRYLEIDPDNEGPVAIQLFGFDPVDFAYACEAILNHPILSRLVALDINMGCPVKKVVKTGAGSALMKNPKLASEIVRTCRKFMEEANKPVTCKFRKGFAINENTSLDFALEMAEAGVSLISYHARTQAQMYSGLADHESSELLVAGVREAGHNIPIIINGDINSAEIAKTLLAKTKADGVMIGREAMRNPFIFKELASINLSLGLDSDVCDSDEVSPSSKDEKGRPLTAKTQTLITLKERLDFAKEHYFDYVKRVGEDIASREIKMIFMKYFSYFPMATKLRTRISGLKNMSDYIEFFSFVENEIADD